MGVLDAGASIGEEEEEEEGEAGGGDEVWAGVDVEVGEEVDSAVLELEGGGVVEAAVEEGVEGDEVELAALPVDDFLLSLAVDPSVLSARRARLKFCNKAASATQSAAIKSSRKRGERMAGGARWKRLHDRVVVSAVK